MYKADPNRYSTMPYVKCGDSGFKLPKISLGLWHNFGYADNFANIEKMCRFAFDNGIIYFDIANNYGYPYIGSAEENFGRVLKNGLEAYRDEICIATKAGFEMWEGPYGARHGSRKYLIASLDQSLKRIGTDYVDIFYHHIYDPTTPLTETALALEQIVRSGKALYVGISNYQAPEFDQMTKLLKELKVPFIINQLRYSMLDRTIEKRGTKDVAEKEKIGIAAFCPLEQGLLTSRYLNDVPKDSRLGKRGEKSIDPALLEKLKKLNDIAAQRGQTLSQMALSWILRDDITTTALIGASRVEQISENLKALENTKFTKEELELIDSLTNY